MKLALSVLQLLLFSGGSNAFATFPSYSFTAVSMTTTRLTALSDGRPLDPIVEAYSRSGKVASSSYDLTARSSPPPAESIVAVDKTPPPPIVESVVDTPVSPPPPVFESDTPVLPTAPSDSPLDTIRQAASDAVEATRDAIQSATKVPDATSTPAAEAVKAATPFTPAKLFTIKAKTAATGGAKAATFAEYLTKTITNPSSFASDTPEFDAVANAKEKFAIIKQNILQGQHLLEESTKSLPDVSKSFEMPSLGNGGGGAPLIEASNNILHLLNLEANGPWFVAATALLIALGQKNAGREEAKSEFEARRSMANNNDFMTTGVAGTKASLETALKSPASTGSKYEMLDVASSTRLKELTAEKEIMQKDMAMLADEAAKLRRQLDEVLAAQSAAVSSTTPTLPTAVGTKSATRDLEKDTKQLLEPTTEEGVYEENAKMMVPEMNEQVAATAAASVAESAAKTAEMAADSLTALKETVAEYSPPPQAAKVKTGKKNKTAAAKRSPTSESKKSSTKPTKVSPPPHLSPMEVEVAAATEEAKQASKSSSKATKVSPPPHLSPMEVEVAAATEEAKKASKTSSKTRKESSPPNLSPVKIGTAVESSTNPWASLSVSTLKRKTVAELTEYLTERRVTVTDETGNTLKKADLVSAVQSL